MSPRFLEAQHGLLLGAEVAAQVGLRAIEGAARVAQGHFLRDQQSGAGVDLGASVPPASIL
jgi:hypothetical protein